MMSLPEFRDNEDWVRSKFVAHVPDNLSLSPKWGYLHTENRNSWTKTLILVIKAPASANNFRALGFQIKPSEESGWAVMCASHKQMIYLPQMKDVRKYRHSPDVFCSKCEEFLNPEDGMRMDFSGG